MDGVSSFLLTQGVLGVACLVLGGVCIKLYNKTEKQEQKIQELQDLRLADSKEVAKDVTTVLQGNSQAMAVLSEKIEIAKQQRRR
jgi:hypothetical protein